MCCFNIDRYRFDVSMFFYDDVILRCVFQLRKVF